MESITSRKNPRIQAIRALSRDAELRQKDRLFLCDGEKLLAEALRSGADVRSVFWKEKRSGDFAAFPEEAVLETGLFDYVSPLSNSPGPLFTVRMPDEVKSNGGMLKGRTEWKKEEDSLQILVLEGVQDPGNVGTVLRTADAFGTDCVILLEGCADVYSPKSIRATMGAIFRQPVLRLQREELPVFCRSRGLKLYAAALSERAQDVREVSLQRAAVCIGSEGRGLSTDLLALCDGELIIPMRGAAESLNAAVAAAVIMWEMCR